MRNEQARFLFNERMIMLFMVTAIAVGLCLMPARAAATIRGAPIQPELDTIIHAIETKATLSGDGTLSSAGVLTLSANSVDSAEITAGAVDEAHFSSQGVDALHPKRIARATYDFAEHTGAVGAYSLGVALPATSIIQRSWYYIVTQLVSAGGNATMALHCETADNILAAADIDAQVDGTISEGVSTGTTANMKAITAACNITATIAVEALTAGKLIVFAEYVVVE